MYFQCHYSLKLFISINTKFFYQITWYLFKCSKEKVKYFLLYILKILPFFEKIIFDKLVQNKILSNSIIYVYVIIILVYSFI